MIKKSKHYESERWKAAREQVLVDMDEDMQRHLRKIKRDLLGQELGDLRSCVNKFLDTSPVDALNAVFNCCLDMFDGKLQKQITKFLATITGDSFGRSLFQLALYMSCKHLLGAALEELVTSEVETRTANCVAKSRETESRPVPPTEGLIYFSVKRTCSYELGIFPQKYSKGFRLLLSNHK